jgi:hypothetical protein
MKLEFSGQIFQKYSDIKFHGNPTSGSEVVLCGRTDGRTDGETDMMKLTLAFRKKAPKNRKYVYVYDLILLSEIWKEKLWSRISTEYEYNYNLSRAG